MIDGPDHDQATDYETNGNYQNLVEMTLYRDILDGMRAMNFGETFEVDDACYQVYDEKRYHRR